MQKTFGKPKTINPSGTRRLQGHSRKTLAKSAPLWHGSDMENHRLVLPEHMNQYGFLFGGYLLAWVDEMAWMAASLDYPGCQLVTVAMNEVAFHKSVREGVILRFKAIKTKTGNTSVTYSISACRDDDEIFSTEVTLVRVDEEGRKQSLPRPQ
ncbi:MAG TPA: acyl-CoA thioesterase [Verrucomicrobiales bacterium]|nr:acyl-CoA thioesterase [Verrucomicrobiales bacterium]